MVDPSDPVQTCNLFPNYPKRHGGEITSGFTPIAVNKIKTGVFPLETLNL